MADKRDYSIDFKRLDTGATETRRVNDCRDRKQALAKLKAFLDLSAVEIEVHKFKVIKPNKVQAALDAAVEVDGADQLSGENSAGDDGHAGSRPGVTASNVRHPNFRRLSDDEMVTLGLCAAFDENDCDNGQRLLKWFGDKVLHVHETGWLRWTKTHWELETGQHAIERHAHEVVGMIKREAALLTFDEKAVKIIDDAEKLSKDYPDVKKRPDDVTRQIKLAEAIRKNLATARHGRYQFGIRSGDRQRTKAMIDQAEPHRSVLTDVLDKDDLAINARNGTVHLEMIEDQESDPDDPRQKAVVNIEPHDPADYISKITGADYDPDATAPNFMADVALFQPDPSSRAFLQVFMGYVALGLTGQQVYGFFYGDGANGKSAFLMACARALGTYHKAQSYTSVSGNNMPTGDKPSPDWARLPGVRYLTIEEVPRAEPIQESLVKLVTSGTPMPVRHLNRGMFDLLPKFTCVMTSNSEPNIRGHDQGIWRRTLILPWEYVIPEAERLPFEAVMARYDNELAGILNWIIDGTKLYLECGLEVFVTDRMREFTANVRADRDAVGQFIGDCVVHAGQKTDPDTEQPGDRFHITGPELYAGFCNYCKANAIDPILNAIGFGRQIKRCVVEGRTMESRRKKVVGVKRYYDCKLQDVPPPPMEETTSR